MPSIYSLTASLQMMNCLRIDSLVSNRREEYDRDKAFFKKHPGRNTYIRHNAPGELDLDLPVGQWLKAPALWLLVSQLSCDTHLVVPVYRGKQFWQDARNNNAVSLILVEMANREGIDLSEWIVFEKNVRAAELEAIAKNTANKTVN